jgi:hypothetical protein
MTTTKTAARLRPHARNLAGCLREFLTPALFKQAQTTRTQAGRRTKHPARWQTQPLLLVLLLLSWSCGDSQAERFETAKAACIVCLDKRRRPGRTVYGFEKALARLPVAVLRVVAAGLRRRLQAVFELAAEGFVVLGCDGSLLECPRTAELEQRLGDRGKEHAAPGLWLTALVHLRTGLLWAWRLGKSTASERLHLAQLLPTLPAGTLLVADAGFNGYGLAQAILQARASFLIRASAKDFLYTEGLVERDRWRDGLVYAWPKAAQEKGQPPLRLRLIRVRRRKTPHDVWLLTDILDARRLPAATAARYYRWRWENEGLFRTYKRTLAKVKLTSRTVRLVHREAEGALLGTQLLLAQGVRALPRRTARAAPRRCSPRGVLREIRRELQAAAAAGRRASLSRRLAQVRREQRRRRSAKEKREWPRRVGHQAPKPPHLLTLSDEQKALQDTLLREAG